MEDNKTIIEYKRIIEQLKAEVELKEKWISLIAHNCKGLHSNIRFLLTAMTEKTITPEVLMSMLPELKHISEKNSKTLQSTFEWVNAQTDGFNPNIDPVIIHSLFQEVSEVYGEAITEKNLSFQFVGNEATLLNTDRFLLCFILKQLLENAIKYSNKGGVVELIIHSDADKVGIAVKDNGVGMNDSRLNTIGTLDGAPYTGTMDEKRAGLSLVIVKDFVEMLNGTMTVSSVEDVGTSVEIVFQQERICVT
ncbi:MAG: HAMP domain-containing histidine kinase [Bacteroidales bacterium]|nr:HAMP domain-containing histidine kinase [Bacteroidales bacterium]